jgi:hypothetical protein
MLAWSGGSVADEYRPEEFLRLDLSAAVLSPKPLGPAAGFVPGPLDVTIDRGSGGAQARAEAAAEPRSEAKTYAKSEPKFEPRIVVHTARVAHPRAEPPRHAARTKLARHHRNPLDAQAFDARVQVWPCKSGGICNWKR